MNQPLEFEKETSIQDFHSDMPTKFDTNCGIIPEIRQIRTHS